MSRELLNTTTPAIIVVNLFMTHTNHQEIWTVLTMARHKFIMLAHNSVMLGYGLYPPRGARNMTAGDYRMCIVNALIQNPESSDMLPAFTHNNIIDDV
jgi:hypothetical protein